MSAPPVRLLRLGTVPGWKSQAVYHVLTREMTESAADTVVLCRPADRYLCLGYFQTPEEIFDPQALREMNIPLYRRRIGGGATYLDSNQLFYQFIFHNRRLPASPEKTYRFVLETPISTLRDFGLNASLRAVNEVEVDGRRIAGIGGGRLGEGSVVVGNFLFDFDYETMGRVWRSPWSGYRELARKALRERVYTLKKAAPTLTMDEVEHRFAERLGSCLGRPVYEGRLSGEEEAETEAFLPELQRLRDDFPSARTEIKRPLKIAARLYLHHLGEARQELRLSFLENEGRLYDVRCNDNTLAGECRHWRGRPVDEFRHWLDNRLKRAEQTARAI